MKRYSRYLSDEPEKGKDTVARVTQGKRKQLRCIIYQRCVGKEDVFTLKKKKKKVLPTQSPESPTMEKISFATVTNSSYKEPDPGCIWAGLSVRIQAMLT